METSQGSSQSKNKAGRWQWVVEEGELFWTEEVFTIFGLEPILFDSGEEKFFDAIREEERERVRELLLAAFENQETVELQCRLRLEDGSDKTIHVEGKTIVGDGGRSEFITGTVLDLTRQVEQEEQLQMLYVAVNQSPTMIGITDRDGMVEYVNDSFTQVTGYGQEELRGKTFRVLRSGHHDDSFYKEMWDTILSGKSWRGEFINKKKNGKLYISGATISPVVAEEGSISHFVVTERDITQVVKQQQMLGMRNRMAHMEEMLGMFSLRWRQPLKTIETMVERLEGRLASGGTDPADLIEGLEEIRAEARSAAETFDDFQTFFRIDPEIQHLSVDDLLERTLEFTGEMVDSDGVALLVEMAAPTPVRIHLNEMVQVLLNIGKNAREAFEERGTLQPEIRIRTYEEEGHSVIVMEDNAGGIDPAIIDRIFDPDFSTKKRTPAGTGLGLYAGRIIVEEYCHGRLEAENWEEGARFTIAFPHGEG